MNFPPLFIHPSLFVLFYIALVGSLGFLTYRIISSALKVLIFPFKVGFLYLFLSYLLLSLFIPPFFPLSLSLPFFLSHQELTLV